MSDAPEFNYGFRPASLHGLGAPSGYNKIKLIEFMHHLQDSIVRTFLSFSLPSSATNPIADAQVNEFNVRPRTFSSFVGRRSADPPSPISVPEASRAHPVGRQGRHLDQHGGSSPFPSVVGFVPFLERGLLILPSQLRQGKAHDNSPYTNEYVIIVRFEPGTAKFLTVTEMMDSRASLFPPFPSPSDISTNALRRTQSTSPTSRRASRSVTVTTTAARSASTPRSAPSSPTSSTTRRRSSSEER